MQLAKTKQGLAAALAAATGTLLGGTAVAAEQDVGWEVDTSVLYYGEQDDRVEDTSFSARVARRWEDGRQLTVGLTLDSLTGATPTGAAPVDQPQTFTRPSAVGQYVTAPGDTPTDDSFKDSRTAGYLSWTQPFSHVWGATAGLSFSKEYDYQHLGLNGSVSRELADGNTTLSAGIAYADDEWDPEGGVPVALAQMRGIGDLSNKAGATEDKTVLDLLLGVTQVINENMIFQANYSFSRSEGYLNDPFKFISELDSAGNPVAGPDGLFSYRFENRPDERTGHGLFAKLKTYLGGGALDTSYRFHTDDWGIDSHTLDLRYRFNFGGRYYAEPHLRLYQQSEADFYQANLLAGAALPVEVSADYRLAEFTGTTAGIKLGRKMDNGSEVSVRVEYYNQSGDAKLTGVSGGSNGVFPDLDAVIVQLNYRFHF
ncbi:MAG: DUF3570 domain-containing protein [Pseudomonadales bacterium]